MTTEQRKKMIEELTANGYSANAKDSTPRLQKKYTKMKKELQKMPNRFAMTNTERNRAKRRRKKFAR